MSEAGHGRVIVILLFFGLLAFSAATGFPETFFDDPLPRAVGILQAIVSNAGTNHFGEFGAAAFFAIQGIFISWLAYRQIPEVAAKRAEKTRHSKSNHDSSHSGHSADPTAAVAPSFGRKRSLVASAERPDDKATASHASDLPESVDVSDLADIEWLKVKGEPAMWHAAALACVTYKSDDHKFLDWLIENDETDRCTAAIVFLRFAGTDYLSTGHFRDLPFNYGGVETLYAALLNRCERKGFNNSNFGLPEAYERERLACLALIESGAVHPAVKIPVNLLNSTYSGPIGPSQYIDVGEGELVTKQSWGNSLPHIFPEWRTAS
jgi:hypothetical protein